ncbi:MAG TPA: SNF2-related protein, partial [Thermoanaerobaculia bacterium]|nr:SNF2-related protein [Thermoanaerobaculia bacterium]
MAPGIRSRGEDYYLSNRVRTIHREGKTIQCTVRGSDIYSVQLTAEKDNLVTSCTCPFFDEQGQTCKHIWAAIRESSVRDLLSGSFNSLTHSGKLVPFRPRQVPVSSEPPPKWRSFLDALPTASSAAGSLHRTSPLPDEILYILGETATVAPKWSLNLAVKARSRKRNGEWGPPKRFSPDLRQIELLDPFDREMLLTLNLQTSAVPIDSDHRLRPASAAMLVEKLVRGGRLYLERGPGITTSLEWDDGPEWELIVEVVHAESGDGYAMRGALVRGDEHKPLDALRLIIPGLLVTGQRAARLADTDALEWVNVLLKAGTVEIPARERDALVARLLHAPTAIRVPDDLAAEEVNVALTPIIRLGRAHEDAGDVFEANLLFRYRDREIDSSEELRAWLDGRQIIRRDIAREQSCIRELAKAGFVTNYHRGFTIRAGMLGPALDQLVRKGWLVEIDGKSVRTADDTNAEISSGIDWFDLGGGARFGTETVPLPDLLTALERHRPVVLLADGSLGIVPGDWVQQFVSMAQLAERTGNALRFKNHQALLIDALLGARADRTDRGFAQIRERVVKAQRAEPAHESDSFRGELRPYQREGLGWLLYLREAGIGGCLADDMGLGKTIQVLALLDRLPREDRSPSIVVAPRSLLFNWKKEAERFTPGLRVLEHHGNDRVRGTSHFAEYDLVLTTYGTMRLDIAQLAEIEFRYAILDEAQSVKNSSSQIAKAVRLLRSQHRLALSGTPIENHIGELWSLFEFLDPGMLGPARWFQRNFAARTVTQEKRQLLGSVLRPLILRRTKEQVAPELPSRTEQ